MARIDELAKKGEDFAFETTMSSRSFVPLLRRLESEDYVMTLVYVWLRSADLAVQRVAERVRRGGHSIPEAEVRRRYERGLANFWRLYRPLADLWVLCDNSEREIAMVARGTVDLTSAVFDERRFHEIRTAIASGASTRGAKQ